MGGFKEGNEMGKSLYEKVFDRHVVRPMAGGAYQLLIGLHLIHELTSPQAFQALRDRGLAVRHPERTFATQDHANPTTSLMRPYADGENETQVQTLERNVEHFGIRYFSPERGEHGIVHVVGPELGLTQPGMTIACGDSHTRRMARSAPSPWHRRIADPRRAGHPDPGRGQTQGAPYRDRRRLASRGLRQGRGAPLIQVMGAKAGVGFVHEFGGEVVDHFSMEERMTL